MIWLCEIGENSMRWIDMHCDTLSEITKQKKADENIQESLRKNHLSVDIERLKRAEAAAQFFACYVNAADYKRDRWDSAYHDVLGMIGQAHDEAAAGRDFLIAEKAADIDTSEQAGEVPEMVAGVLTVEEGGVLNGHLSRLEVLYDRGVRLITLTWNYENCIGSPNSRDSSIMQRGLTDFGFLVVERMNELGMMIDVSHLSDGGFWDCIRYSRAPVTASHSNVRSLCRHPRNLSDDMLHALGDRGGVAGINFYSEFLRERRAAPADKTDATARASVEHIADHAAWMIKKAGEDAVALGTDFDGFGPDSLPEGIRGVEDMGLIWEAMRKKGITPRQIEKIAYGNVQRIIEEVWH